MQKPVIPSGFIYIAITFIAVLLSFILHELAHLAMGEMLGYKMGMTLNTAYPIEGMNNPRDEQLISIAGPVFTILQAVIIYFLLIRESSLLFYPLLFTPLYMRLLAGVMNSFNLNDEGRVSQYLGLGIYTLSIIACAIIAVMIYHVSKKRGLTKKFQLINFFLVMVFTSVLILMNQNNPIKII